MPLDLTALQSGVAAMWRDEIIGRLTDYIRIPAKSPAFDPDWQANGHIDAAVELMTDWAAPKVAAFPGGTIEVVRLPGRTPVILVDLPGALDETVLLYGHLDKQPEMEGWDEGLGPWQPVLRDGKLYGRGGADDGYALFAALCALDGLRRQQVALPRCVILIEASEESASFELPFYLDHLADRLGEPSLVVCLDSGCGNYDQMWLTTSLRGLVGGDLSIEMLTEGVHSGDIGGAAPDPMRVARMLLSRIERESDGVVTIAALQAEIPQERVEQARRAAQALGDEQWQRFPWAGGTQPVTRDNAELLLNRTWRPSLAIIGCDHIPPLEQAGNVLLPKVTLRLSLRTPPTTAPEAAARAIADALTRDPPYGAKVEFRLQHAIEGWNAPALPAWLGESVDRASQSVFGREAAYMGEGGAIPFVAMLGNRYPDANFVITGVLGPHSNAHGPNEFLHLATAERITCCVAQILADHAQQVGSRGLGAQLETVDR